MTDDSLELLQKLGFTATEAKAWLTLARAPQQTLSGYEVAKRADIPRANVYPVLKRLVERRAIRQLEDHSSVMYAAVPSNELLAGMRRTQRELFAQADAVLPRVPQGDDRSPVYTLTSTSQVLAAARKLVHEAKHTLFIALERPEAALLADALRSADERGVRIVTLCMEACATECGGCRGTIHRCEALQTGDGGRWLLVAADDAATVAAELGSGDEVRAIETRQALIVQLANAYVRQSAALAVLGGTLGDQFNGLVSLQARSLLDDLRPTDGFPRRVPADATDKTAINDPKRVLHKGDLP